MATPEATRLAWAQRIAALILCVYWIAFWQDHSDLTAQAADIEWSFLLPDILFIALAFVLASQWLLKADRRADALTAIAGGALFYLGFLDTMMNIREGNYTAVPSRGALNALVNVLCLGFGAVNMRFALKRAAGK